MREGLAIYGERGGGLRAGNRILLRGGGSGVAGELDPVLLRADRDVEVPGQRAGLVVIQRRKDGTEYEEYRGGNRHLR